jgi:hypothetical protein
MGQDLEHGQIHYSNFDAKALLKNSEMKLRIGISKFSSFVYYFIGCFYLLRPKF